MFDLKDPKFRKVLKGAGISAGAAALTYFLGYLDVVDVDITSPILYALIGSLLNAVKVLATKYEQK